MAAGGNVEIERKFLVAGDGYKRLACGSSRIRQGYICSEPGRTVRVRLRGGRGYLTIKGPSADGGLSRYEFEREITADEANALFDLCEPGTIDKTRWIVEWGGHTFEVDEFHGCNDGLTVAEVELASPTEQVDLPPFAGREVTGDRRFYNSSLTKRPFTDWSDAERAEVLRPVQG